MLMMPDEVVPRHFPKPPLFQNFSPPLQRKWHKSRNSGLSTSGVPERKAPTETRSKFSGEVERGRPLLSGLLYYGRCITGGSEAAALSFRGFREPSPLLKLSFSNRTSNMCLVEGFAGGLFSPGPLDANTSADLSSPRLQGVTVNQG